MKSVEMGMVTTLVCLTKETREGITKTSAPPGDKTQDVLLSLLMWIENIGGRDGYYLHLFLPRMEKAEAMAASHFPHRVGSRGL